MTEAYRETEGISADAVFAGPILAWKVHLLRRQPARLLLIVPIIVVSLLVCYLMFRSPLPLVVTVFLFCSALSDYLFPVKYEITEKGASARTLTGRTFIEWERVKKYYVDDRGIKLSPLGRRSRLEAYRGVYLRFGDRRDEVTETVRRMRDVVRADARA